MNNRAVSGRVPRIVRYFKMNEEHYKYIKVLFDCGSISWEYQINGSDIVGRGQDDQDPDDCMDYSDDDIKQLVRGMLTVEDDDPVEIQLEVV